jgi:hypothetical protein
MVTLSYVGLCSLIFSIGFLAGSVWCSRCIRGAGPSGDMGRHRPEDSSISLFTEKIQGKVSRKLDVMPRSKATERSGGDWWCPNCFRPIESKDVTYDEHHDPRHGGCGGNVYPR